MSVMAVKVGGIYAGAGANELRMRALFDELRRIHGPTDYDDYVVDLAFCTYLEGRRPNYIDWRGIKPGPVEQEQRRFIVWIEVPPGLPDAEADRRWMLDVLARTAELIREHVPPQSKAYPVDRLAQEVLAIESELRSSAGGARA
jgi:hypothetical protein